MVRELQTVDGVLTPAATYLTGPRGMEYRRDDGTGVVKWYVYDGLGSVVGELDPSGNLTCGKKYDVYGAERTGGTGTSTTRQGFCGKLGHIADAETGLVYMRARYYDPNIGRFVSEDPAGHGKNWYIYASNNPVNKIDFTGKVSEAIIRIIMSALIQADQGLKGTGRLEKMSVDEALEWIQDRIQELKGEEKALLEESGEASAFSDERKVIGDEDGASYWAGRADQFSQSAAERAVSIIYLDQLADYMTMLE